MKNMSLKNLYKFYEKIISSENYSQEDIDIVVDLISRKESQINENTSATGGPAGSAASSSVGYGSSGVSLANATISGMGSVVPAQPSAFPGALNGVDWISGGGKSGSGDISVPYNPSGKNRVFQKIPAPMGNSHGARTGKKSRLKGLDLKKLSNLLKKNKDDMKKGEKRVLNFDDFQKDKLNTVTKVKEGRTYKSAKPDKKIGKSGLLLTDKKENFRTEIQNLAKSRDCDTKRVGNDLEIHLGEKHIAQVMFRDEYVGVQKIGQKFPKEFEYNQLGKIKSEVNKIITDNIKENLD